MRTLKPGQRINVQVERMGSDWWLIIKVAGLTYRAPGSRADLKQLARYILEHIGPDDGAETSDRPPGPVTVQR